MSMIGSFTDSFSAGRRPANLIGNVTATGLISFVDIGDTNSYQGIGNTYPVKITAKCTSDFVQLYML